MPKAPEAQARPRPMLPNDDYLAYCVGFADMGTHHNDQYNKDQRLIRFEFELPDEPLPEWDDGGLEPRMHQKDYNFLLLSTTADNQGNFWPAMQKWLGVPELSDEERRNFNPADMVGKPARVELTQYKSKASGRISNVIESIKPIKAGQEVPEASTPLRSFDWDLVDPASTPDEVAEAIKDFPKWTQEKIMESEEYQRIKGHR